MGCRQSEANPIVTMLDTNRNKKKIVNTSPIVRLMISITVSTRLKKGTPSIKRDIKLSEPSTLSARTTPSVTEDAEIVPSTKFPIVKRTNKRKKPMIKIISIVLEVLLASFPVKRKTGAIKNGISKKDNMNGNADKTQSALYFHVIFAA